MSLHNLAKHVQSSGRGKDTQLVHMTNRELQGLQALARAKGGSLSINPNTGLPEAGFLEDILPVVAAGAAIYFTGGAAAAALGPAGFGLGATTAGILGGAGAGALIGGGMAAIQGKDVGNAALMGGVMGGIGGGIGASGEVPTDPNVALQQTTAVGVNPIQVNPSTGTGIDPLASLKAPVVPQGGVLGPQAMPGPNVPTSTLTPTANYINSAAPGTSLTTPGIPTSGTNITAAPPGVNTPLTQAPPPSTSSTDVGKWWDKQTPWAKAGYSTAGAGLLTAALAHPNTSGAPTDDYESELKRLSPNFHAQAPIQPNPYYRAQYPTYAAEGGIMSVYADGGPVERMTQQNTAMNPQGGLYPQGMIDKTQYATPTQRPTSLEVVESEPSYDARVNPMTGTLMAAGGLSSLGGYSDGGQLLKGPGDGVSDSIPASIADKQPARLADGEFVVPARIVSELGNGSTDAGARKLYAMMDRVQSARKKSIGKGKVAANTKAEKLLPV